MSAGLERFARTVVEALADRVAVLKPQSAFFERFGSRGIAVLESTIRQSREAGALVLLDVKRGDIGSTMAAYADAYLDPDSSLCADAITVSPYLGVGSLRPAFDSAAAHGGGVFVLALTSNPEGPAVQHAVARRRPHRRADRHRRDFPAQRGCGAARQPRAGGRRDHRRDRPRPVQGQRAAARAGPRRAGRRRPQDLRTIFGESLRNVLPSYSREVLGAGPDVAALRAAAARARGRLPGRARVKRPA